jgi:hypothetical protein
MAFVILFSASRASAQTISGSYFEESGKFYESVRRTFVIRCVRNTNADDILEILANSYYANHKLYKEAKTALRSEQRAAWRTYVTEHRRSMTEGGKNAIKSSPNIFRDWRDALRPVYFCLYSA